jgi:DMSO/TMAO reductase YedYZ heme-binding membrane subunit
MKKIWNYLRTLLFFYIGLTGLYYYMGSNSTTLDIIAAIIFLSLALVDLYFIIIKNKSFKP